MTSSEAATPNAVPTFRLLRAKSVLRRRSRNQALTPVTKSAPSTQPDSTVWLNLLIATGERRIDQKSCISLRTVSGLNSIPTGYCIQAFATSIHSAEMVAPATVSHVEARWAPRLSFFHPKNMSEMKVASMKKARIASMARGAPKISPTNQL